MLKRLIVPLLVGAWVMVCVLAPAAPAAEDEKEPSAEEVKKQKVSELLQQAEPHLKQKEWAKAVPYLTEAFEIDPSDETMVRRLIKALYREERWTEIVAVYNRWLEASPDMRRENLPRLASYQFKAGDTDGALATLETFKTEFDDSPLTHAQTAGALLEGGHIAEARALLEDAVKRFPDDVALGCRLGHTYAMLEDYDKAIATYEGLLDIPESPSRRHVILRELGILYTKAGRLDELAERVLAACDDGELKIPEKDLAAMIRALGASNENKYSDMLFPLLDHPDVSIAQLAVRSMANGSDSQHFPLLVLDALESDRPEVVDEAIRWSPNCRDRELRSAVHERLRWIFEGDNEALKFHVCFPLMHDFKDKEAIAYLLEQTQSEDRKRARRAIGWLGDSCNSHTPVYPELLEKLEPHLASDDDEMRRTAVDALGTYEGEAVIRHLITALGDEKDGVARNARTGLVHDQNDRDTVLRLLNEALEKETSEVVKERMREVIQAVETQKRRMSER